MGNEPEANLETKALLAVVCALLLKLVHRSVLTVQDATEPLDAALAALEELPRSEVGDQLRSGLERAASALAAKASD